MNERKKKKETQDTENFRPEGYCDLLKGRILRFGFNEKLFIKYGTQI